MFLNKQQLLAAGPKRKEIHLDELDGSVVVKALAAGETIEYAKLQQAEKGREAVAYLLTRGVRDEAGKEIFSNGDVDALMEMSTQLVNTLVMEVLGISKMLPADAVEKKEQDAS